LKSSINIYIFLGTVCKDAASPFFCNRLRMRGLCFGFNQKMASRVPCSKTCGYCASKCREYAFRSNDYINKYLLIAIKNFFIF